MAQAHTLTLAPLAGAVHQADGPHASGCGRPIGVGRAQRATVLMLRSLDGRTLKDIGIDRSEIESVVYGRPDDRRH